MTWEWEWLIPFALLALAVAGCWRLAVLCRRDAAWAERERLERLERLEQFERFAEALRELNRQLGIALLPAVQRCNRALTSLAEAWARRPGA